MSFRGGLYQQVHELAKQQAHQVADGTRLECHHLLARQCLVRAGLDPDRGPAIWMTLAEHLKTSSWGNRPSAKRWRAKTNELLAAGQYEAALAREIEDIRGVAGSKYDAPLEEALAADRKERARREPEVSSEGSGVIDGAPARSDASTGRGDVSVLVTRLTSYLEALDRHNLAIQRAYEQAQESLSNLRRVYRGAAADDFLAHWDRTTEALERYLQGARSIRETLEGRLSTLREADRPADGL